MSARGPITPGVLARAGLELLSADDARLGRYRVRYLCCGVIEDVDSLRIRERASHGRRRCRYCYNALRKQQLQPARIRTVTEVVANGHRWTTLVGWGPRT